MTETKTDATATNQTSGNVIPLPTQPEKGPREAVTQFVRDHPVMVIAGGLAIGLIAAAVIPRRARRSVAGRASRLANAIGTAGAVLGERALTRAQTAGSGIRQRTNLLSHQAERLGDAALDRVDHWSDAALDRAGNLLPFRKRVPETIAEKLSARAGELRRQLRR